MPLTLDIIKSNLDTVWVLFTGCLVFFMCTGFAMLETGFCRIKHTVNVLAMNFAVVAASTLAFWAVGFGFMFGNGNGLVGTTGFLPDFIGSAPLFKSLDWATVPIAAKFFFQLVFADAAATIVSGIVAERMKFSAYMLFAVLMIAFLYPVTGHWAWGGGFLSTLAIPFQDFAGSTIVHSVGGWASLVGAIMVGSRIGKFGPNGEARNFRAHNLSLATLGTLILWLGWFGFNPGSSLAADAKVIAHVTTTTMLASAAALTASMFFSMLRNAGKTDLGVILNGTLGGLVAITAGCNAVSMSGAIGIGLVAGLIASITPMIADALKIDDPVGVLSVHLMNGIWGTLAVGLFATKAGSVGTFDGLFYGGGTALLVTQVIGVAAVGGFTVFGSIVFWSLIKALVGLRVSAMVEIGGLDLAEHGAIAYPEDEPIGSEYLPTSSQSSFNPRTTLTPQPVRVRR